MFVPKQCIDLVKKWEGCSLTPYLCPAGVPTIGYGCTHYPHDMAIGKTRYARNVKMKDPAITQEEADAMLEHNLSIFWQSVDNLIKPTLNDNQMSAIVSLAYNIGLGAFRTSTILRKINHNPEDPTIRDEFLRWNKVNGDVVRGLHNRRVNEAGLYFAANPT